MSRHILPFKCAAILMCLVWCAAPAEAASLELRWSELAPIILEHRVKVVLPGGQEIQGQAVAVREDALVLDIEKTSDRKAYPKGQGSIPRTSLTTLQVETIRGSGGRTMGLIAGVLGGVVLGGDLIAHTAHSEAAAISSFLGISTGSAIAGYYAGRGHDRQVTIVKILHEQ
jgi:hypothetical protein